MRPHSNDTLVLPFSPFPHPRFTGLQKRSLHFGRDDRWKTDSLTWSFIPLRGSILRLWRAPSLRSYSYCHITPLIPKHATYLPDESPSALAYRHPERRKTPYVRKTPARTSGDCAEGSHATHVRRSQPIVRYPLRRRMPLRGISILRLWRAPSLNHHALLAPL